MSEIVGCDSLFYGMVAVDLIAEVFPGVVGIDCRDEEVLCCSSIAHEPRRRIMDLANTEAIFAAVVSMDGVGVMMAFDVAERRQQPWRKVEMERHC